MYGNENINIKRGTGLGKVANNSCLGSFGWALKPPKN